MPWGLLSGLVVVSRQGRTLGEAEDDGDGGDGDEGEERGGEIRHREGVLCGEVGLRRQECAGLNGWGIALLCDGPSPGPDRLGSFGRSGVGPNGPGSAESA